MENIHNQNDDQKILNQHFERMEYKLEMLIRAMELKEKPFMTMDEASAYTGIPKNTLYQYTSENRLPFHKNGKRVFFKVTDLNRFVLNDKNRIAPMERSQKFLMSLR